MPFGNGKKNTLEDLFSSVLPQFKKYHPPRKPEIYLFRHFPKLKQKLRIPMEKNPFNPLERNTHPKDFGRLSRLGLLN